jgi:predicted nucleotidyltransferase component of viral defense system
LLGRVQDDDYLSGNMAFKGGTCLIKAHLGYFRFSEDVDFTWKDRTIWEGKTLSATKRSCSGEIDEVIRRFRSIGKDLDYEFNGEKNDMKEVHLSSGGRMMDLYVGYHSELYDRTDMIKIEINFVEDLLFPVRKMHLRTYLDSIGSDELRFLFDEEYENYSASVDLDCYDAREIFIEKCRAALTRKVYKLRDMIDIYYLEENFGYGIDDLKDRIISKIRFSVDLYKRYRENMDLSTFPGSVTRNSDEMDLLIVDPPVGLLKAIPRIHSELETIRNDL